MSTTETHHPLWVAYGPSGVVGQHPQGRRRLHRHDGGRRRRRRHLSLDGDREERAALAHDAGQRLAGVPRALTRARAWSARRMRALVSFSAATTTSARRDDCDVRRVSSSGRAMCTSGPIRTANRIVPMPTVPPSSQPTTSTVSSTSARQSQIGQPRRAFMPVIRPSRGPGPKSGADVQPGGDRDHQDAAEQHRESAAARPEIGGTIHEDEPACSCRRAGCWRSCRCRASGAAGSTAAARRSRRCS